VNIDDAKKGKHMNNIYDDKQFFDQYAKMSRSQQGLAGAGEWHQFKALFPDLSGKNMLDLGCGYGWHCKYAVERGAEQVLRTMNDNITCYCSHP